MRRLVATLTVLMLLAGAAVASAGGGQFRDAEHHRFRGELEALADLDVLRGCDPPDNTLVCPDEPVTRGQLAAIICRVLDECVPTLAPVPTTSHVPIESELVVPWDGLEGRDAYEAMVEHYFHEADWPWAFRVIQCESGWDPTARNPSGASGLMQNMARYWSERSAAAGWAGADIFDPEASIAVGAWLFYHGGGASHWTCR